MQKAIYTTVGIDELLSHVQALKGVGARFVQMHAERNVDDGSYRLVYTFINVRAAQEHIAQDGSYAIENLVVEGIDQYQEIPSISSYYPAVFPFENEAHDLFGLAITDMQIDILAARQLVYTAASLKDQGKPFSLEAAACKVFAAETAMKHSIKAIQIQYLRIHEVQMAHNVNEKNLRYYFDDHQVRIVCNHILLLIYLLFYL